MTNWVISLPWQALVFAAWLVSFGALDLGAKSRGSKGAVGRVWRLFYPFLLSREPWPITVPSHLCLPWWNFDGWRGPAPSKWRARVFALSVAAVFAASYMLPVVSVYLHNLCGQWFFAVEGLTLVALAVSLYKSVPLPHLRPNPKLVPLPFAGRRLFTLPELTKAWSLMALAGLGIYLVNYYAVQMNELRGAFMNSITERDQPVFYAVLGEFAVVIAIYSVLGPVYNFVKELIVLEWTKFTTRFMLNLYTKDRNYYPVSLLRKPDNPNERIQQDVPAMCRAALMFAFIVVDSIITFILFGNILYQSEKGLTYDISLFDHPLVVTHLLLWILVGYAIFGSNGVMRVGKRLIKLQADQKRLGADFRVGMVLFEKYAEPIAAYHGEEREYNHLWRRFMLALKNNYSIIGWQRNLGFFTGGYSNISGLLPYAALAPFYFAKKVAWGTISQAAGAFGEILASASIFVSEFDRLSALLASVDRVGELRDTLEALAKVEDDGQPRIKRKEGDLLTIEKMTLFTPDRSKLLVRNFDLCMQPGRGVLIKGPSGSGKTSILRAIVGLPLWDRGDGVIAMPSSPGRTLMLSQLAYLPSEVSLREQMLYPTATNVSDAELLAVLGEVNLGHLPAQLGGLDATPNWDQLSGGERQRLVVARALVNKVRLVIADEATSGLDIANEELLYGRMKSAGMTMLSVGHRPSLVQFHDDVVELAGDGTGGWKIIPASQSQW